MAEEKYISDLTGEELDAALRNMGKIHESLAAAEASANLAKQYADSIDPTRFATAAQGQLAQSAVQAVNGKAGPSVNIDVYPLTVISGEGGVRNCEGQKVDLFEIDPSNPESTLNTPEFFGSNSPKSDITNSPVTSRPFYGYRTVLFGRYSSGGGHFITVRIVETHPDYAGDILSATFNVANQTWGSWRGITGSKA